MSDDETARANDDASAETTDVVPSRHDRRDVVRQKAAQVQARQRRMRFARGIALSLVAVVLVGAAGVAVGSAILSNANRPQAAPHGLTGDAIVVDSVSASVLGSMGSTPEAMSATADAATVEAAEPAEASASPTAEPAADAVQVTVYIDYLSEASSQFEAANARQLSEWVSEGAATIAYHPVAMLTAKSSGTKYSLRAAAAAACVATHAPDSFFAFNHDLLSQRPDLDTEGHDDTRLADIATAAGADPKLIRPCIEDQVYVPWVQQATTRALQSPVGDDVTLSGPTVLVNGKPYLGALDDPKEFAQFVFTLASDAYFSTPTPTPAPTTTPSPSTTP